MDSIFSQGTGVEQGAERDMECRIPSKMERRKLMGNEKCEIPLAKFQKKNMEKVHFPASR